MKRTATLFLLFAFSLAVMGQTKMFSGQNPDSVVRINPQMQQFDHVPGEILVKFRDNVPVNFKKSRAGLKSSQAFMNTLIRKYGIVDGQRLFPNEKRLKTVQILTAPNGEKFARPSLHNIFLLKLKTDKRLMQTIQSLKADSAAVAYAEPNYIYSVVGDKADSPVMTEKQAEQWVRDHKQKSGQAVKNNVVTPNDPLYSQQWGIPATQVNQVWDSTTGDTTQIIGILDTGVDWKHPDLKDNIWTNTGEIPGNGIDDDGDGFVDDVRGWDFINHDNNPMDDNSHGTHVAGIAAAEGNNGIGIAGVDWHAKILPIKVFQSSGRGDAATITKGIIYAANHGATVINMSFGGYARSLTMEAALENAYATSVLVAAAGNDSKCIGPPNPPCAPFFPAALSFVLGTQATKSGGKLSDFSNFDQDGPFYSRYPDLLNYELKAPGSRIISTIPNGNYRFYSGTSMSTPLVSGCVALYSQLFPGQSQELMWGNLVNTTAGHLQLYKAITVKPKPQLWFVSKTMVDTLSGDNRNGLVDAGETIQLWFLVKNTWGQSDSVHIGLRFGEFEDTTTAQIIKSTAFIGSISPYATRSNEKNPLLIHINSNVAHNRDIVFEARLWYTGAQDTVRQKVILNVENGELLSGMLADTLVLTPDKFWLISGSFKITPTGVLIIRPGTHMEIKSKLVNDGMVYAHGKPDSLITISGTLIEGGGKLDFKYVNLYLNNNNIMEDYTNIRGQTGFITNSLLVFNGFRGFESHLQLKDCVLKNWNVKQPLFSDNIYDRCNISNIRNYPLVWSSGEKFKYCNLTRFSSLNYVDWFRAFPQFVGSNNILGSYNKDIYHSKDGYFNTIPNQYWGTSDSSIIEERIYDFLDNASFSRVIFTPFLKQPTDSAHGCVWKVLVDTIDPQDQKKLMNPIGVGPHRFDIYFNRPMDTAYKPMLTFGVRAPYNQQAVSDSGHWSHNNTVWTAYKTIKLLTGDGINRIRVSGARDPEGFEIPIEDLRYQFVISAAESSSLDFMATPGLGKVNLEWNNAGLKDLLGFNMYRMQQINDSTLSTPVLVNKSLILDTLYTDFSVVPNKKYYYYYKVVNTDFSESDSSHVVSAVPFTASRGDANGDMSVNVLDITAIVSYMLDENPQPFIVTAADVNGDSTINVLDIIGVVQLINGKKSIGAGTLPLPQTSSGKAWYSLKGRDMYLESDGNLAALQFRIKRDTLPGSKTGNKPLQLLLQQKGFEFAYRTLGNETIGFLYSLTGKTLPKGNIKLLRLEGASWGDVDITPIFGGDRHGNYVTVLKKALHQPGFPGMHAITVYPNPFGPSATIYYKVPEKGNVALELYNLAGQKVRELFNGYREAGKYTLTWNRARGAGQALSPGIYILRYVLNEGPGYHVQQQIKVVITR